MRPTIANVAKKGREEQEKRAREYCKDQENPERGKHELPNGVFADFKVHVGVTGIEPVTSSV